MRFIYLLTIAFSPLFFVSCGSSAVTITNAKLKKNYSNVVVRDFSCKVPNASTNAKASTNKIADFVVSCAVAEKSFSSVSKNGKVSPDTLIIAGDITNYDEGNAALRFAVGFGAGKAYISGDVRFIDGGTNKVFGTMQVEDSITAGGVLGAMKTPESMVRGAAEWIASESVQFSKIENEDAE